MGDIYIIKSPSHRVYIGQTIYDYKDRFRDHLYDAFDPKKDHCKKLNRAIRKYGKDQMNVNLIRKCCSQKELDHYEDFYIRIFNSIRSGYNIKHGGKGGPHTEETKIKISRGVKGIPKPQSMKTNLSKSRNKHGLPMYMIKCKNGYRIVNHPVQDGRERKITSSCYTEEEKKNMALEYLTMLNKQLL